MTTKEKNDYLYSWIQLLETKNSLLKDEIQNIREFRDEKMTSTDIMIKVRQNQIDDNEKKLEILYELGSLGTKLEQGITCCQCKNFYCKDNNIGEHSVINCLFFKGDIHE